MKKIIFLIPFFILLSCGKDNKSTIKNIQDIDTIKKTSKEISKKKFFVNTWFLGHNIKCDYDDLPDTFAQICSRDPNLSIDKNKGNITIYGTTFHLNCKHRFGRCFYFLSSVKPYTRRIKRVRDAISRFHGKENFEEDWHYSWLPFNDSIKTAMNYPIIHLRKERGEGTGTAIIIMY